MLRFVVTITGGPLADRSPNHGDYKKISALVREKLKLWREEVSIESSFRFLMKFDYKTQEECDLCHQIISCYAGENNFLAVGAHTIELKNGN